VREPAKEAGKETRRGGGGRLAGTAISGLIFLIKIGLTVCSESRDLEYSRSSR
jgi:hypothetical protein